MLHHIESKYAQLCWNQSLSTASPFIATQKQQTIQNHCSLCHQTLQIKEAKKDTATQPPQPPVQQPRPQKKPTQRSPPCQLKKLQLAPMKTNNQLSPAPTPHKLLLYQTMMNSAFCLL
ncbi:hypothetical protein RHGRI_016894 [Rhododendron griersonianum]|uniref:Uncharacterized protein n=1 Tax=Rhododendron griersonianum TaxID=479676 RepID=A0AAV6JW06_9ERIC|nr:hypothetical protein RHGRI_016894 [Rhododendron griersonianum]